MENEARPNRIEEWRRRSGLSFRQIAAACSPPTTASQIQKLERGDRGLDLQWMRKIAAVFHIKPTELLNDEDVECRLTAPDTALLEEIRALKDSDPTLLLTAVRAMLRAMEHTRTVAETKARLPGDPMINAELAEVWTDLNDGQRAKALEIFRLSRGMGAPASAAVA